MDKSYLTCLKVEQVLWSSTIFSCFGGTHCELLTVDLRSSFSIIMLNDPDNGQLQSVRIFETAFYYSCCSFTGSRTIQRFMAGSF